MVLAYKSTLIPKPVKLSNNCMIYGYVRVSTQEQSVDSQKNSISRYCIEQKLMVDEWIELEMSSRKSTTLRRIDELLDRLSPNDTVVVSELSRLGGSVFLLL